RDDDNAQRARADWAGNEGVIENDALHLYSVDNETQAERIGETILRENVGADWICQFSTTVKGLAVEPGDIIDVTHPSQPEWAGKHFRVEDITHDEQDHLVLRCSEYFASAYI